VREVAHDGGLWNLFDPDSYAGAGIEDALDAIADAGVAVEIDGSGVRRDGRPYPDAPILAGLVRRGVPVSFAADAHRRAQLGLGWGEAVVQSLRCGRRELVACLGRRPQAICLA